MKRTNIIIGIISLTLIIINVFIHLELKEWRESIPKTSNDAQSGIGIASVFAISWFLNSILTLILLIISIIQGIRFKKLFNVYTLLIIVLIIFTFFIPPILTDLIH